MDCTDHLSSFKKSALIPIIVKPIITSSWGDGESNIQLTMDVHIPLSDNPAEENDFLIKRSRQLLEKAYMDAIMEVFKVSLKKKGYIIPDNDNDIENAVINLYRDCIRTLVVSIIDGQGERKGFVQSVDFGFSLPSDHWTASNLDQNLLAARKRIASLMTDRLVQDYFHLVGNPHVATQSSSIDVS